jgi:hypothetical protein
MGAARISATLRKLRRTRKRRVHLSEPDDPAEELTARAFVPPFSERVTTQQTVPPQSSRELRRETEVSLHRKT